MKLQGVIAATPTPLKPDLSIDLERLVAHCRWLLDEGGCDGVNLLGTTGEAMSFSVAQRPTARETFARRGGFEGLGERYRLLPQSGRGVPGVRPVSGIGRHSDRGGAVRISRLHLRDDECHWASGAGFVAGSNVGCGSRRVQACGGDPHGAGAVPSGGQRESGVGSDAEWARTHPPVAALREADLAAVKEAVSGL
jgi:hypothetical protein